MPRQPRNAGRWLGLLDLPHPNMSIKVATGEQAPIRAPGHREDRTGMRQRLQVRAAQGVPELDSRIIPTAGKQTPIGGKSHTGDAIGMPPRPQQGTTL